MPRKAVELPCPASTEPVPYSPVDRCSPSVGLAVELRYQHVLMQRLENVRRNMIYLSIGATALFFLTGLVMKDGRISLSVKLKDWLEVHAEVDKTASPSESPAAEPLLPH